MSSIGRESSVALEDENEIERVFRRFDANGDGKISANDLRKVLLSLGTSASQEEIQRMMKEIDTNDDGFVDLEEFKNFHRDNASPDGGLEELREAFDLYDLDKNGLISAIELHKVLNGLGEKCSMEDCRRMIGSVDADRDGYVNFEEFKRMMTNKSSH